MTDACELPLAVRQQMAMARPWEHAGPDELWEVTGACPDPKWLFVECLAVTVPGCMSDCDDDSYRPLFHPLGPGMMSRLIDPSWITRARPLLIVHRDDPGRPYYEGDQDWIDAAGRRSW